MVSEAAGHFSAGKLPSAFQLRSALQVGRLIDETGTLIVDAHNSYRLVPTGGLYRFEDFMVGEEVLLAADLLSTHDDVLYPADGLKELSRASEADGCEILLYTLLEKRLPLWLKAATNESTFVSDLIPDQVRNNIEDVLQPETREHLLLQLARRFNDKEHSIVGALAEKYVVQRCVEDLRIAGKPNLANSVRRVSQVSDQLGYDITAPRLDSSTRRLEVKGTRVGSALVRFHLSRNEAERACADPDWSLVVCRVTRKDFVDLVGWLSGSNIEPLLPRDLHPHSQWQSVRLEISEDLFVTGLPPI